MRAYISHSESCAIVLVEDVLCSEVHWSIANTNDTISPYVIGECTESVCMHVCVCMGTEGGCG